MPNIHFPQFKSVTEYCNHYFKKYNREAWLKVRKKRYEQIRNNDFYLDTNVETFKKEVLQFWELGYSYRNSKIRKESCEWVDFQDENGEAIEGGRIIDEINNLELRGNYSWSRLNMGVSRGDPTNDIKKLKSLLLDLFNKADDIDFNNKDEEYKENEEYENFVESFNRIILEIPGLGYGKVSALLHIKYPDKCGVWNGCTDKAFKILGNADQRFKISGNDKGKKYIEINKMLLALLNEHKFENLSDVDIFVWYVANFP